MTGKMEDARTKILFCSDQELEKRRARIKAFRGPKERKFLLEDAYEQIREIADSMILDGFSDAYIDELLSCAGFPGNEQTFDFLRFASLIMGEDFVRDHLLKKELTLDAACRMIREDYHEKEMKPFREIYENLDEKLKAAREGESKISFQIDLLKLHLEHAKELYEVRIENLKMKYHYEMAGMQAKAQSEIEKLKDKIKQLSSNLEKERSLKEALARENEKLSRKSGGFLSWWKGENDAGERASIEQTGTQSDKERDKKNTAADERRIFCIQTLGNENFSPEQVKLLMPCLEDEAIPLSTLKILCRPGLPSSNMKGLIRYIKGGFTDD